MNIHILLNKGKYNRFEKDDRIDYPLVNKIICLEANVVITWLAILSIPEIQLLRQKLDCHIYVVLNGFASFSSGIYSSEEKTFEMLRMLDGYFIPQESHVVTLNAMGVKTFHLPLWASSNYKRAKSRKQKIWDFIFVGNFGSLDRQGVYRREIIAKFAKHGSVLLISDYSLGIEKTWIPAIFGRERLVNYLIHYSKFAIATNFFPNISDYNVKFQHKSKIYSTTPEYCIRPRAYCYYMAGIPFFVERSKESFSEFGPNDLAIYWDTFDDLEFRIVDSLRAYSQEVIAKDHGKLDFSAKARAKSLFREILALGVPK